MGCLKGLSLAALTALNVGVAAAQQPLSPEDKPVVAAPAAPVTTAGASTSSADRSLTAEDVEPWLDGFMPYALHSADIAGAVVTVVKDGQVVAARGYGWADIAHRNPVDPNLTLFRPGSVSKLVTWTAVMQQVEAGKLDLDADVNRYLDFAIPPRDGQPITLRQIMTHTAGFEEAIKDLIAHDPKSVRPLGEYLKRWTPRRIFDVGTTPAYSNWATCLAGYMVERVSGMPFDDYVEQRIFQPIRQLVVATNQIASGNLTPSFSLATPVPWSVAAADFNHDGVVGSQDFFDFLIAFFAGCR